MIYTICNIGVNQPLLLLVGPLVKRRLFVVKFWRSPKFYGDFFTALWGAGVSAPNPPVVQGSTVTTSLLYAISVYKRLTGNAQLSDSGVRVGWGNLYQVLLIQNAPKRFKKIILKCTCLKVQVG